MTGDLAIIKGQLQDRIEELCRKLLPQGRDEGGQWVSFNPITGDRARHHNPALKIRLRGGVIGAWIDHRSGDKGDVIGLIAYIERTDTKGALKIARDFLGIRHLSPAERARLAKIEAQKRETRAREDAALRARKLAEAEQLFRAQGGERPIGPALVPLGTFGYAAGPHVHVKHGAQHHAEAYFAERKVPLAEIATFNPWSLRFSPQTEWWKGASWRHDDAGRRWKSGPGPLYPAIHSAMRNRLGAITACHLTFLDPSRPAKAPVEPPKLMWGEAKGAVIEIATGPGDIPFWRWQPGDPVHPVVLAEGIETAMSFAVAGVPARIWACGSLSGVGAAPIDLPSIGWALFARDNNFGNPTAQKQFSAALEQLESHGKTVVVEASHHGDDFNDLAQGVD
ncbi:MAG: toprim domain-containing protein [Bauldia sp.]|nr:toprim domain-containing protein [Bauldia sp.]